MTVRRSRSRSRLHRLVWLVGVLLVAVAAAPAASAAPAPLPSARVVKGVVGGVGPWHAYPSDISALGARPRGCRSDRQLLDPQSVRAKSYAGREGGQPRRIFSGAEIVVLGYADEAAARAAFANVATYPRRCPKVVEWVCTECDGISTTWRTRVPVARVRDQSVAWRLRDVGNLRSSGYAVVARYGASLVRVTVTRTRDIFGPHPERYPRPMPERKAVRLARLALGGAV